MTQKEILELKFLRFFFDQCDISLRDRIIIEESFELCFDCKVPEDLKVNRDYIKDTEPDLTSDIPCDPKVPNIVLDKIIKTNYTLNNEGGTSLSDIILKLKNITKERYK